MQRVLTRKELVEITEKFQRVGEVLKKPEYIKTSKDYLLKIGLENLSLNETFELIKEYKKALVDLKNNSAIGTGNRKFYINQTELMNRYEKQLRQVELEQVYEPLEELGIKKNPQKKVFFTIKDLKARQVEIDEEYAKRKRRK